jgi:hypothetical protein
MAIAFAVVVLHRWRRHPTCCGRRVHSLGRALASLRDLWATLVLFGLVLGGMYAACSR